MSTLNDKQKDFCSYAGLFGALISVTCFIQLMVITRDHWMIFILMGINLFALLAFVMLGLQKSIAPWLLIAVSVLLFVSMVIFIMSGVFSMIVLVCLLYSVIIVVCLFAAEMPKKLRAKALAQKAEEMTWRDKL